MALVGRLLCLALISAGLGTASLTTLEPAAAAVGTAASAAPGRAGSAPTAVAVTPSGSSYVGFASGGRLVRLTPKGVRQGTVRLDQDAPVDGLFVNAAGQIWVDYGTSVSLLGPGGRVLRHFDHQPAATCAGSPASRYGGITVAGGRVWVANRCDDSMSVYGLGGRLVATVDLPGRGHPRGITYGAAQSRRGPTVYVALPDSGRIVAYLADRVRSSVQPWRTVTLRRPGGGERPRPGGIAVDRRGQLTVADMANNAIYLLDSNHEFNRYRTLGHPPRASRAAGRLNNPSAISQYAQDGGSLSGNLFIADTGNQRVQRWNTSGWTYWVKQVRAGRGTGGGGSSDDNDDDDNDDDGGGLIPGDGDDDGGDDDGGGTVGGTGPVSSTAPSITGSPAVGATLTCSPGAWYGTGGPLGGSIRYAYSWQRGTTAIAGATATTYVVSAADAGTSLRCVVTATNNGGSTTKASAAVVVGSTGVTVPDEPDEPEGGPVNTALPTVAGVGSVGSALTCTPGGWSGRVLDRRYAWSRDGTPIAHTASSKYVVLSADVGAALGCTVTASNADGETAASSTARTVAGPSASAPGSLTPPSVAGNPVSGQTLTCDPGTWSGSPATVMALWQRDGVTVANGSWTYLVGAVDVGAALQCVVLADNGWGLGAARSAPAAPDACAGATGVEINDGAAETTSAFVTLTVRAPRGTTTVRIANNPAFTEETVVAFPAGCTLDWMMPSVPGLPLSWTVYVRYGDGTGATYDDSIVVNEPS